MPVVYPTIHVLREREYEKKRVEREHVERPDNFTRLRSSQLQVMGYPRPFFGLLDQIQYDMEALHRRRSYRPVEDGMVEHVCSALPYTWVRR